MKPLSVIAIALPLVLALTACGVDGEPVRPTAAATVGITNGGISASGGVGLRKGPFAILFGF
jgi:hypothetical protein